MTFTLEQSQSEKKNIIKVICNPSFDMLRNYIWILEQKKILGEINLRVFLVRKTLDLKIVFQVTNDIFKTINVKVIM